MSCFRRGGIWFLFICFLKFVQRLELHQARGRLQKTEVAQ
jgi:hypothetical protein